MLISTLRKFGLFVALLMSQSVAAQEMLEGKWPLQVHTLPDVEIKNVHIDKDENDQLFIAGRVRRKAGKSNTGGYVAISFSDAGRTYFSSYSNYVRKNTYYHDHNRGRYFRVDIPKEPSEKSVVRLIYFNRKPYE